MATVKVFEIVVSIVVKPLMSILAARLSCCTFPSLIIVPDEPRLLIIDLISKSIGLLVAPVATEEDVVAGIIEL